MATHNCQCLPWARDLVVELPTLCSLHQLGKLLENGSVEVAVLLEPNTPPARNTRGGQEALRGIPGEAGPRLRHKRAKGYTNHTDESPANQNSSTSVSLESSPGGAGPIRDPSSIGFLAALLACVDMDRTGAATDAATTPAACPVVMAERLVGNRAVGFRACREDSRTSDAGAVAGWARATFQHAHTLPTAGAAHNARIVARRMASASMVEEEGGGSDGQ